MAGAFTRESEDVAWEFISCHASPICFEKHYREYMIASLPHLKVLDNLPIKKIDRERATVTFSQYFEYLPYKRKYKESVVSILQKREIRASQIHLRTPKQKSSCTFGKSKYFYTRSLCAAKVGSSAWPFLHPLSISKTCLGDEGMGFRPRQFEYHPSDSSLMVFGTLDGEVVVVNHEKEQIVSYIPSLGAMNSVLGLCWLKNHPSKVYDSCRECGKERLNSSALLLFSTYNLQLEVLFWEIIVAVIFAECYFIRIQNVLLFPFILTWSHAGDRLIKKPELLCSMARQDVRFELS